MSQIITKKNKIFFRTARAFSYKTYSNDQTSSTKKNQKWELNHNCPPVVNHFIP